MEQQINDDETFHFFKVEKLFVVKWMVDDATFKDKLSFYYKEQSTAN